MKFHPMQKPLVIWLTLLLASFSSYSQTEVSGLISTNSVWKLSESPILVTGNVKIISGASLKIEAGVVVKINNSSIIQVDGELAAKGTPSAKVIFTSTADVPSNGDWKFVHFTDISTDAVFENGQYKAGSILQHCVFEYGGGAGNGTIFIEKAAPFITECEIIKSSSYGIKVARAGNLVIRNSRISENNQEGIFFTGLQQNNFTLSNSELSFNNGRGIYFEYGIHEAHALFKNNLIHNNKGGIFITSDGGSGSGSVDIIGCDIHSNTAEEGAGVYIIRGYNLVFKQNLIRFNKSTSGGGLYFGQGWNPYNHIIENNVFYSNEATTGAAVYMDLVYQSYQTYVSISKNIFIANNGGQSTLFLGDSYKDCINTKIQYNTFEGNEGLSVVDFYQYKGTFSQNNFQSNDCTYFLKNSNKAGTPDVIAKANFLNGMESNEIQEKTFDWNDDGNLSSIIFEPALGTPDNGAPIASPKGFFKGQAENGIRYSWLPNKESDFAGYKLNYNFQDGKHMESLDVLATTVTLANFGMADKVLVTAYDIDADGSNDLLDGHESWYSAPAVEFFTTELLSSGSECLKDSLEVEVLANYNFGADNYFILQLSEINGSFIHALNIDSLREGSGTIKTILPDTLQDGKEYLARIISSELNVFTEPFKVVRYRNPFSEFSVMEKGCQSDTISLNYNSPMIEGLSLTWNLDGGKVIENIKDSLLTVVWTNHGNKEITLTATENGCSSSTSKKLTLKKVPTTEFNVQSFVCEGELALITYTGNGADTATYLWDFDGGVIESGEGKGPYKVSWEFFGTKNISLKVAEDNCASDTRVISVEYNQNPALAFECTASTCFSENYQIKYTGVVEGEISWDFNEANVISGEGPGPYLLNWNTPGEKAINFSINNSGCIRDTIMNVTVAPESAIPEICMVTVDEETSRNTLIWSYEMETVESFGIYRETDVSDEYTLVEYVDGGSFISYTDVHSLQEQQLKRYRITALDSCGVESDLSSYHRTIYLTINRGEGNSWDLTWDAYEGFAFENYRIFRGADNKNMELLTEIPNSLTSYTDSEAPHGEVYYRVEVINPKSCEGSSNESTSSLLSSKSNVVRSSSVTGLSDSEKRMSLYPNPTKDRIQISFDSFQGGSYVIKSLLGQEVRRGQLRKITDIDLSEQTAGIYLLTITFGNEVTTTRIIKN